MQPPKLLLAITALALLNACGVTGPPIPPELELPKPVTDLRAARKGGKVYLTWTIPTQTTEHQTVRRLGPTHICRSLGPLVKCGTPVDQVATAPPAPGSAKTKTARPQANYTDTLSPQLMQQNPTAQLTYAVEVVNDYQRSAGLSDHVQVPAAPVLPPPTELKAQVTTEGVLLSWTPLTPSQGNDQLQYVYRAYRREEGPTAEAVAGELALTAGSSLVDANFVWEKTYDYRVTVVTRVAQTGKPDIQVEGDDTAPVKVFAHDVFPPSVPSGLQAVFSGVGQQPFIDLVWTPGGESDLAGYNVFRHEEGAAPVKINSEIMRTPAYRDANVQSGKKYFYSVSALDIRGNESARSEEANEQVP